MSNRDLSDFPTAAEAIEWAEFFIQTDCRWLDDWNADDARAAVRELLFLLNAEGYRVNAKALARSFETVRP